MSTSPGKIVSPVEHLWVTDWNHTEGVKPAQSFGPDQDISGMVIGPGWFCRLMGQANDVFPNGNRYITNAVYVSDEELLGGGVTAVIDQRLAKACESITSLLSSNSLHLVPWGTPVPEKSV